MPVATAYYCIFSDKKPTEQTFFISGGAGAVAQYAIQFAKLSGAKVITTVSNDTKKEICKNIGADLILNYKQLNEDEILNEVIEYTKGNLIDRCVEVDFGFNVNLIPKILKSNGVLASYSCSSNPTPNFPYYLYAPKGINIKIVQAFLHNGNFLIECGKYVNSLLINKNLIHPNIKTFLFKDTYKAHEAQEDGLMIGKLNIKIW